MTTELEQHPLRAQIARVERLEKYYRTAASEEELRTADALAALLGIVKGVDTFRDWLEQREHDMVTASKDFADVAEQSAHVYREVSAKLEQLATTRSGQE